MDDKEKHRIRRAKTFLAKMRKNNRLVQKFNKLKKHFGEKLARFHVDCSCVHCKPWKHEIGPRFKHTDDVKLHIEE